MTGGFYDPPRDRRGRFRRRRIHESTLFSSFMEGYVQMVPCILIVLVSRVLGSVIQTVVYVIVIAIISILNWKGRKLLQDINRITQEALHNSEQTNYSLRTQLAAANLTIAALQARISPPSTFNAAFAPSELLKEVLEEGRRAMAKKYHPDLNGGNGEKMKQVNAAVDKVVGKR